MRAFVLAITLRKIAPTCSGTKNPQHAVDELAVVRRRPTNMLYPARKYIFDPQPLRFTQLVSTRHYPSATNQFNLAKSICGYALGRNRLVIIENQLETTDHTHLGQLITYAAGLEAAVVVWISRQVREEHRQALDWLNRGENTSTEYFGLVVELLQIDSSKPAVNLRVVASPNSWSRRSTRSVATEGVGEKYVLYRQFFQRLIDELREKHRFTNARVGQPQNWYTFAAGTSGFQYGISFAAGGRIRAEIYIDFGECGQNVAALDVLGEKKPALERAFGEPLEWERLEGKRACRIAVYRPGMIEDSTALLEDYHRWAVDHLLRFKKVFGPELPEAAARAVNSSPQEVIITEIP